MIRVPAETVQKSANELPEKVMDEDETEHSVLKVPAPFSLCYINVAGYFPGEATFETESLTTSRENKVQSMQGRSSSLFNDLSSFRIFSGQALCKIVLGNELLVRYRNMSEFHGSNLT